MRGNLPAHQSQFPATKLAHAWINNHPGNYYISPTDRLGTLFGGLLFDFAVCHANPEIGRLVESLANVVADINWAA